MSTIFFKRREMFAVAFFILLVFLNNIKRQQLFLFISLTTPLAIHITIQSRIGTIVSFKCFSFLQIFPHSFCIVIPCIFFVGCIYITSRCPPTDEIMSIVNKFILTNMHTSVIYYYLFSGQPLFIHNKDTKQLAFLIAMIYISTTFSLF